MVAIVSGNSLGLSLTSLATLGQRGVLGSAGQGRNGEQGFVNIANGNLVLQDFDDRLEARGLDVVAVRTYNSQGTLNDDNGDNWTVGPSAQRVQLAGTIGAAGSTLTRTDNDGAQAVYAWNATKNIYVSSAGGGAFDTIAYESTAARFVWTDGATGLVERYESTGSGRLTNSVDPFGNTLSYAYNANGTLLSVTNANGEITYFDYTGTNLTQIRTVATGNVTLTRVRYAYDSANRLSTVTVDLSPGDNSVADGNKYVTTYTYDGSSKRVASVTQSDGTALAFTYDASNRVTSVTDGLSQVTTYSYASGSTRVTDPMGLATVYAYDAAGQLTQIIAPPIGGVSQTTSFTYNADGDVMRVVDSGNHALDMQYDANGNQVLQRDSAGNTLTRTFDARNQVLTETVYLSPDPDGSGPGLPSVPLTTRYVYNGAQLRFVVSAEGRVTQHNYNSYGQRTSTIGYSGGAYAVSGLAVTAVPTEAQMVTWTGTQNRVLSSRSDMSYDARGKLQQVVVFTKVDTSGNGIVDGSQSTTQYVYDRAGLLLSTVNAISGQTQYVYDGLGRLLSTRDALNQLTLTSYDDANNKTTVTLANGLVTTRAFDRNGRLVSVRDSSAQNTNLGETVYAYDKNNRVYLQTDPTGARSVKLYDELGRLAAEIDAVGRLTEYKYNNDNLLSQKIVYEKAVSASALDTVIPTLAAGNQATVSSALITLRPTAGPADQKSWRIYDAADRLVRTVAADGAVTDTNYDGASRIVSVMQYRQPIAISSLGAIATLALSAPAVDPATDRVTRRFYDGDGLLRGTLDAEGYLTELRYDAAGRASSQLSYANPTNASLRATGTLTQLIPNGNTGDMVAYWFYDAQGRISGEIDAEGYLTERVYDNNGNVTQTIRYTTAISASLLSPLSPSATVANLRPASQAEDRTTVIVYDKLNRVTQQTNAEGAVTQYTYDTLGRVVSKVLAAGTTGARTLTSRYDLQGRLVGELTAQGSALLVSGLTQSAIDAIWAQYGQSHVYDAAGRRVSTTDAYGNKTLFFYDRDSRLTHVVNALGEVSENEYNPLGQLKTKVAYGAPISLSGLSGGLTTQAFLNAVNVIRDASRDSRTTFTYTLTGRVATQTDALGNLTQSTYNAFGDRDTVTQAIGSGRSLLQTQTYDRRGLVTGTVLDASGVNAVTSAVYDAFGRLTRSVDANLNVSQQRYDRLGRVVSTIDPSNGQRATSYDAFGRVFTQTDALGRVTTYSYNKASRSLTVLTPEGVAVTTVQTLLGQTQSIVDGLGQTTSYSYDLNGNLIGTSTPLTTTSAVFDRAGRLSQTTDANGNIVVLTYDAANRVLTRTVDPSGLNLTTSYAYDAKGQQIKVTDPNSKVTRLVYDLKGQLVSQTVDPGGLNLETKYTFDGRGKTLTVVSPEGTLTTYTYDNVGRRLKEAVGPTGAALITTSYAYDKKGNVTSKMDASLNPTRYVYDANDRLVFTLGPVGQLTRNVYDAENRITKVVAYAAPIVMTGLSAAPTQEQIEAKVGADPLAAIEHRVLDRDGRVVATVNGLGEVVKFVYDANGRVIERIAYANRITLSAWTAGTVPAPTADASRDQRTRTVYDALGRATFTIDGVGAVVKQIYDGNGNVVERIAYANVAPVATAATRDDLTAAVALAANNTRDMRERFVYDRADRVSWRADGAGAVTRMVYDSNGNLTKTIAYANAIVATAAVTSAAASPDDRITDRVYDAANRQTYVVDALGGTTKFVYDKNGNVVTRYAFANPVSVPTPTDVRTAGALEPLLSYGITVANRIERSVFDAAGRRILAVDATGAVVETKYDALNNPVRTLAYAKRIDLTSLVSEGATKNQIVALLNVDTVNDRVVTQAFDASQRLVYTVDAIGYVIRRNYDALGHVTKSIRYDLAIPAATESTVDAIGLALGPQIAAGQAAIYTYTYDAAGRTATVADPLGFTEKYAYNGLGQKTTYTNQAGSVWTYSYDAGGRLTQESSPSVALTTLTQGTGGAMGNVSISATANANVVTRLAYDALGNLTSRTEAYGRPEQRVTTYGYDALGHQIRVTYATVSVYDAANDNATAAGLSPRVERSSQRITETSYNVFGEAVRNRDRDGTVTAADIYSFKTYDRIGNLRQEVDALGFVTAYTRNAWGEVTELVRFSKATGLVTATPPAALTVAQVSAAVNAAGIDHGGDRRLLTTYDRAGRATRVVEPQVYGYDSSAGALYQYFEAGATTDNSYDAFGNLIQVARLVNSAANTWVYTQHYFDRRGGEVAKVDPMGYLTTQEFDPTGALTRRTEFAKSLIGWNPASPTAVSPVGVPNDDDRTTKWVYDRGGRKLSETRFRVEFSVDDKATRTRANLVTTYGYDAVGNTTSTTDANGATTYTYYDALGRISAVVSPVRAGQPTPVTRFLRDAIGNVVAKIETQQAGSGATAAWSSTINTNADDANRDRVTTTRYDAMGNATQSTDAQGVSHYSAYDAFGHVAKEWQGVKDAAQSVSTLFRIYQYDKLGHQTAIIDPASTSRVSGGTVTTVTQAVAGTTTTALEYNGFGELVRKGVAGGRQEYFDYDNAGRVWRTNADGGVDKGALYNLLGQQTAELQNAGAGWATQSVRTVNTVDQMANATELRRTDMVYDAAGHVVQTRGAERADVQGGASATRLYSRATLVSSSTLLPNETTLPPWSGSNSVNVSWSSLSNLGSGDIKVELEYATQVFTKQIAIDYQPYSVTVISGGVIRKHSEVIAANILGSTQATLTWPDEPGGDGGISRVTRITIYKKDVNGYWQPAIDQPSNGYSGHAIEVAAPDNSDSRVELQIRPAGSSGDTGWVAVGLVNFGSTLRFNASGLPAGNYEYRVQTTPPGGETRVTATGTLGLTAPVLATISTPLSFPSGLGLLGHAPNFLSWASPGRAVEQVFRFRPVGSTGAWDTRLVTTDEDGKDGISVVNLGAGNYEYELLWTHAGDNSPYAHATGKITLTGGQAAYSVPPVNLPELPVTSLRGVVGGTVIGQGESNELRYLRDELGNLIGGEVKPVLRWPVYGGLYLNTTFSYRVQGNSTWQTLPIENVSNGLGDPSVPYGWRQVDVSALASGTYEYKVVETSQGVPVHQATGRMTVAPAGAGHYEPHQTPVQVQVMFTPPDPSQYIRGWTTSSTYGPPVVMGYDVTGKPIYGQGYGREVLQYGDEPILGPVRAFPYNTYHTEMRTQTVPVQVQVGTDPVYARDEGGNLQYETVWETQYRTRDVPVYTDQWVPRTETYIEWVNTPIIIGYEGNQPLYARDEAGNIAYQLTAVQRTRTVYDWRSVHTGWRQETYPVQVPVQRLIIVGYTPRYETQMQTQTVAVQVATLVTPADPEQFLIAAGAPIYGQPVVIGEDEFKRPIYGQGYSMVNGVVKATPYLINQTQWQTTQVWVPDAASAPSLVNTTPVYVPGRVVAAVPAQYGVTTTTPANSASVSDPTSGNANTFTPAVNGYSGMVRPTVTRTFDRWGNVLSISDPRSSQWLTTYTYNFSNQLIEQRQPDAGNNAGAAVTQVFYDRVGRQVAVKDANGNINAQVFDELGNLVQEKRPDDLDANGNVRTGGIVNHRYNIFGDRTGTTDAMSKVTAFSYDNLGRLLKTTHEAVQVFRTDAAGKTAELADTRALVETNVWDDAGRKLSQTNGNLETISYAYDLRGNVVRTTQHMGQSVKAAYDSQGRKIAEVNGNGAIATWTYDYFGQLQAHQDFGGKVYGYSYDDARQLTSSTGVVRRYTYDKAGQLIKVNDDSIPLSHETRYAYDLAGNRLREYTKIGNDVYQDNHMAYDALGRMRWVSDGRAMVNIEYDKVGNRTRINTHVLTGDTSLDSDLYFKYDSMNRQTVVDGVNAAGDLGTQGHKITYDLNGNRASDTWLGNKVTTIDGQGRINGTDQWGGALYIIGTTTYVVSQGRTTENYAYDALGRLVSVTRDGVQTDHRLYDGASRVIRTGPAGSLPRDYINALNGTNWAGETLAGTGSETHVNRYNGNGQILSQYIYKSDNQLKSSINYENVGGYDGAGNLMGYTVADHISGQVNTYTNTYEVGDTYRQKTSKATSNRTGDGLTTWDYYDNGQLKTVRDSTKPSNDRTFVNDLGGTVLYSAQGTHVQRQLVVNGEVLGRYGEIRDPKNPSAPNGQPNFQTTAKFNFGYQPVDGNYPSASPGTYAVSQGDTLQGIARGAYGDESSWYLIAEANGLSGNEDLKAGQVLTIPTRIGSSNKSGTFKPYDPSTVIGDTTPNLPVPKAREKCGGFGQIVVAVIAVAATVLGQPYIAGALGSTFGAATTAVSWAAASAAGSVVSQGVGVAIGAQDSISWKGVALSAIGGGISAGIGASGFAGAVESATGSAVAGRMASMALGNAVTQGVAVATGLQSSFSWRSVAASAVSVGVSQGLNSAMGYNPSATGIDFGKSLVSGIGGGFVGQVARGGKVSAATLAADAFGNALGDSIAAANGQKTQGVGPWSDADYRNGYDIQSDNFADEAYRQQRISQLQAQAESALAAGYVPSGTSGMTARPIEVPQAMAATNGSSYLPSIYPDPQLVGSGRNAQGLNYYDFSTGSEATQVPDQHSLMVRTLGPVQPNAAEVAASGRTTDQFYGLDSLAGAVAGTTVSLGKMAYGAARMLSNNIVQIGDMLTGGIAHDTAYVQRAWAENTAAGAGMINAVSSPRESSTNLMESIADRYSGAMSSGSNFERSYQLGELFSDVGQGAVGLVAGGRSLARAGAIEMQGLGLLDDSVFVWRPTAGGLNGSIGVPGSLDSLVPLRITTVTPEMSTRFQGMGYIDPLTNRFTAAPVNGTMAVDHIFPSAEIVKLPGFNTLTRQQMNNIIQDTVDLGNLQPLPKGFNSSKGSELNWTTYKGQALDKGYAATLADQQRIVQTQIRNQIRIYQQQNSIGGR